jgi:hypothetical protein
VQTEIPVADNTVNSFALGIWADTVTGNIAARSASGPATPATGFRPR